MENLVVSTSKKITLEKFLSQVKVVTQNSVKKVLNISASSQINSCDGSAGMLSLSGKIKVDVLYLNLENVIEKASGESDFFEKQKCLTELNDVFVNDILTVSDINFSSNEIMCSVSHNTEINGVYAYEIANFENDETVVVNESKLNLSKFISSANDNFFVAEENETNLKDIQILKVNSSAVIDDVLCSVDKIVVEGRVFAEVLYVDEQGLNQISKQVDFKQEIQSHNTTPNMKAIAYVNMKTANISIDYTQDKSVISYNFDLAVKGYVFEEVSYNIANDLFMLNSNVNITYGYLETKKCLEMIEQSESILSQTDITQIEDFDDLIGVFEPKIELVRIDNLCEKSEICAKLNAYALYKSKEGIERLDVSSDIKFEMINQSNVFVDEVVLLCEIVSAKVKAGKEIEVVFKANCHAVLACQISSVFVKSFEIADEKTDEDAGIKVYIAKQNQTVFEVAKALNVKPELIYAQNEVDDTFEAGQKVYVYSPINLS